MGAPGLRISVELVDLLHDVAVQRWPQRGPLNPDRLCDGSHLLDMGFDIPDGVEIGECHWIDAPLPLAGVVREINERLVEQESIEDAIELFAWAWAFVIDSHPYRTANHRTAWTTCQWILHRLIGRRFDESEPERIVKFGRSQQFSSLSARLLFLRNLGFETSDPDI